METIRARELKIGDSILIGGHDGIVTSFFPHDDINFIDDVYKIQIVTDVTYDFVIGGSEEVVRL